MLIKFISIPFKTNLSYFFIVSFQRLILMNNSVENIELLGGSDDLKCVTAIIAKVSTELLNIISLGDLYGSFNSEVGSNSDGDQQKSLDIITDNLYFGVLESSQISALCLRGKR